MSKNYFDNDAVTKAILKYQKSLKEGNNDIHHIYPYTTQIQQLVKGVINTHKIYRWWDDVDELIQEGMLAIYSSFKRFDSTKGTAFNYLSIVVKQHLKNWTQNKNKKMWNTSELQEEIYIDEETTSTPMEDMVALQQVFFELELPQQFDVLVEFLLNSIVNEKILNRRDLVKQMLKEGFPKKDVDDVFNVLTTKFGGLFYDKDSKNEEG
jgi:DNA-directed RNA polymerase specialized sigma subunit